MARSHRREPAAALPHAGRAQGARRRDPQAAPRAPRRPAHPEPVPSGGRGARRDLHPRLPRLMSRDARLFLAGQSVSLLGDTSLWLALAMWAKDLTGSNGAAGIAIFCVVA